MRNMGPVPPARRGRSILPALAVAVAVDLGAAGPRRAPQRGRSLVGARQAAALFGAGSLAVIGYANASMLTESRPARAAAGGALAVGAGVAKELWDLDGHGDASWRDLTWDLIGAATGVLLSLGVDWAVHRMFHPPPGRSR